MDYTTNYNLKKPNGAADGDFVKVEDLNSNFDTIDTGLKENADRISKLIACSETPPSDPDPGDVWWEIIG